MTTAHVHGTPAGPLAPPAPPKLEAWRLFAVLGISGGIAGLLIVVAFGLTQPTIQRNKAERLRAAVQEVLKAPDHFDTLYVTPGGLVQEFPTGADPRSVEQVYIGYTADSAVVGFAIDAAQPGFADIVRLIFGYDPASKTLLGMKVLENKETPGLGDKIEKSKEFVGQFAGAVTPLKGVKPQNATGDAHEIDMITGATISSRVVIRIINTALERLQPMIEAYMAGGTR